MSRIGPRFEELRSRGERALVPFVTAGDPDLETSLAVLRGLADSGADLLEIGVPFSDPVAEGPVIQQASERALKSGTSLRRVLGMVAELRREVSTPLPDGDYSDTIELMVSWSGCYGIHIWAFSDENYNGVRDGGECFTAYSHDTVVGVEESTWGAIKSIYK